MRPSSISSLGLWLTLSFLWCWCVAPTHALTEEIEATPTNTNGFEIGELSMPQYVLLMLIFLKLTLLYAVGVLPLEIDLGGLLDPSSSLVPQATGGAPVRRSVDAYYQAYDTHASKGVGLQPLVWDCPLQFVCEVDYWANRDHDTMLEGMLARWLRNSSNTTFSSPKGRTFAGLPDSCPEMYPCPFDVQDAVGFRIPGSAVLKSTEQDHPDADGLMDFY